MAFEGVRGCNRSTGQHSGIIIRLCGRLVDIIVQRLVLDSELYANVWLSVMLPTLTLAVVVRVIMVVMALRIALTVYGKGLKGVNPYEKEVELPRALTAKLRRQPKLLDAVKALVHGQQLRIRLLDDTKVYGAQASPIGAGGLWLGLLVWCAVPLGGALLLFKNRRI